MRTAKDPGRAAGGSSPARSGGGRGSAHADASEQAATPAKRRPGRPKALGPADLPGAAPSDNPLDHLPPKARGILDAARRLLAERGFDGLTIEAVANEAGVSRGLIPYYFGSRTGMVGLLMDSLLHQEELSFKARAGAPWRGDWHDYLEWVRLETRDVRAGRDYVELIVACLREEMLRQRTRDLYDRYRELNLEALEVSEGGGAREALPAAIRDGLGRVMVAIDDGLQIQAALYPDFDIERIIAALRWLLEPRMAELHGATGPATSRAPRDVQGRMRSSIGSDRERRRR